MRAVVRAGSTGLTLLAVGPWLTWLPLDLLDMLPGTPFRALPLVGRLLGLNRHRTTTGYAYLADAHLVEAAEKVGAVIATAITSTRPRQITHRQWHRSAPGRGAR
ncbi:MAG: hypothetical protein OXF40_03880, partial [Rhodospirillales bacterium]|nr:hypothetical protein [Rhodospirillales bacterium]